MSSLYVNGETGQVGIGTSDPSNLLHVEVNGNTPGNVEIMTRIENVEFPPVATSNVGFVADYGDVVASIDVASSTSLVEFPPTALNSLDVTAGPTNLQVVGSSYGNGTYVVSADSIYSSLYQPWKVFNDVTTDYWVAGSSRYFTTSPYAAKEGYASTTVSNTLYNGSYLQIQMPNSIILQSYQIMATDGAPNAWVIAGSANGVSWSLIDSRLAITGWSSGVFKAFSVSNNRTSYAYYRIIVLNLVDNWNTVVLTEMRLFGDAVSSHYPKYKCNLQASSATVANGSTYGAGVYSVFSNSISKWMFLNETTPAALVDKNTLVGWQSSSNIYTSLADAPALATPSIYFQLPDVITLTGYTLTARSATLTEVPTKWNLYGSNLSSVGAGWSTLDSRTAATTQIATPQTFTPLNVTAPYNLFRFDLLQNASATPAPISLAELKLTGSKPTSERRLVIAGDGRVGINTSVAGLNNDAALTVAGDLAVTDIYVAGIIGDPILQTGPYVTFDGSAANRDKFLAWMQYVTSPRYRCNFGPTVLKTSTWWNTSSKAEVYDSLTYSTVAASGVASYAYFGGVLLPDGRVVFCPAVATTVGLFNPATNAYTTVAAGAPGGSAYFGGVLLPDGRVVFIPHNATTIGLFNPTTNAYTTIAGAPGGAAYIGGVLLPDGRVVFVPFNATTIGLFNPATNAYTTIAGAPGSNAYLGGVLLPDGRVVFIPHNATTIGLFNPTTNAYTTIAGAPGGYAYSGGVLLPDGRVVFVPHNATTIGLFNPATNAYTTIAGAPGNGAYCGGVILSDGRVIFVPRNVTTIGLFNPVTNTYTTFAGAPGTDAYFGGVLLPDGRVVFVPTNTATVGILNTNQSLRAPPLELCYHPCFNKL